jgi:hypothetical protein
MGCAWDSQSLVPHCFLAKHECFAFQDVTSCKTARCQWNEYCRADVNVNCPFKVDDVTNPCESDACQNVDSGNVPRECCDVAVKHCKLHPEDPGCSSDEYLQTIEKCYGSGVGSGVYGKCELEVCADLVKKCNGIADCAATFKCVINAFYITGDCNADCMKGCQANLATKAGSEVFDLVLKCELACHDRGKRERETETERQRDR